MKKKILSLMLAAVLLLALLAGCGGGTETTAEPPADSDTSAPSEPGGVATEADMTEVRDVVEEGMTPVYADCLKDGVYPVTMESSSSMFKADRCDLVVEDGTMQVVLYMSSESYPWMYAGTAAEAAATDESAWIPRTDATFTLPLAALDSGESYAAFSERKQLWYDRTLLFRADSLPADAFVDGFFVTAESLGLADGTYTADVTLYGGTGRATVTSPATLTVSGGAAEAKIEWSSPNYDYMRVDEELCLPVNAEGNSVFMIPVSRFDRPMPVTADTTAMSEPHEIEYRLTFDSASLQAADA